jgi:regulator of protease activity HflC (stomatin/prohibitin superfamily)
METAFSWLGQIFDALLQFVPRRVIIRATEGGVKWSLWRDPKEMKPGIRWYWPLISDVEVIVTARQTINTRTQSLMTRDSKTVVAGGVVIYRINDVVQAIGRQNWSPDDTASDITQAAIVSVVSHWECADLLENISGKVEEQLTATCRKQLRQYGIYVSRAALVDFSIVRQLNHSGINLSSGVFHRGM